MVSSNLSQKLTRQCSSITIGICLLFFEFKFNNSVAYTKILRLWYSIYKRENSSPKARFDLPGRGGRGGRCGSIYPSPPKWTQTPTPKLKFRAPNLSSNQYFPLNNQYRDTPSFISQLSSDSNPTMAKSAEVHKSTVLKTFFNDRNTSRKKQPNKSIMSVMYYKLQQKSVTQHSPSDDPTTETYLTNLHQDQRPSQNTLQPSSAPTLETTLPLSDRSSSSASAIMSSNQASESSPPSDMMGIDTSPSTPRRDKKSRQRDLDPASTPSKKRCDNSDNYSDTDVDMDDPPTGTASNTSPSSAQTKNSSKKCFRINSVCTEETIRSMSTENILKELVSVSSKLGSVLTFDAIKTLPKPVLITRAIEFRDKLKLSRQSKPKGVRINTETSEETIRSFSQAQAISAYLASLRDRSMPIDKAVIDQMSPGDITNLLISYRSCLITSSQHTVSSPLEENPSPNDERTPDNGESKEPSNNVSKYTSTVQDEDMNPNDIPSITQNQNRVKTQSQRFISIRTKWYRDHFKKPHVELVNEIVRIVREVDSEMHLIPSKTDSQLKIYHEDAITRDCVYDYMWNNSTNDKTMKTFTLQFMIKTNTKYVSKKIVNYMAKTKNYCKADHLNSEKISCVGFFHNFHPEYHHCELLRKHCVKFIKEKHDTDVELSIFPRQISAGRGLAKTSTRAVVCETSEDHAQLVTNALMQCPSPQYTEVKFIPFTRFDESYITMVCKIIDAHRKFLQDVEIIRIPRMQLYHDKLE